MVKFGLAIAAFGLLGLIFTSNDANPPPGSGVMFFVIFALGAVMATKPIWYPMWLRKRAGQ